MLVECGHCGAPLAASKGRSATITCNYCGQSQNRTGMRTEAVQIPQGWKPPAMWIPPAHVAASSEVTLPYRQSKTGGARRVVMAVMAVTAIVALMFVFAFFLSSSEPDLAYDAAAAKPPAVAAKPPAVAAPANLDPRPPAVNLANDARAQNSVRIAAPNLSKMDPADLIAQAVMVSKTVDPQSKLIKANFKNLRRGLLDLRGDSKGLVYFEYRYIDSKKPPGKDTVTGSFAVLTKNGALMVAMKTSKAPHLKQKRKAGAYPLPLPQCRAKEAFAATVKSGVPDNAVQDLHWYKVKPTSADKRVQWSFRVDGHPEYRREISDRDCSLLKKWKVR